MKENIVKQKSFAFAVRIVKLCRILTEQRKEYILSGQLVRSGTAIGALIREAEQAESSVDFVHKMSIALKEANETEYWIELLLASGLLSADEYNSLSSDAKELLKILISIVNTSKVNLKKKNRKPSELPEDN